MSFEEFTWRAAFTALQLWKIPHKVTIVYRLFNIVCLESIFKDLRGSLSIKKKRLEEELKYFKFKSLIVSLLFTASLV